MLRPSKKDKNYLSNSHKHSPEQEAKWARELEGKVTPGSGSGNVKGDVRVKGLVRLENKTTDKKSFSLTREIIEKIEHAALNNNEIPFIQIDFIDPINGQLIHELAVVPTYVLRDILNAQ